MNWMLMDMNSYFASVEQYLRPELRGRPVGVIPVETDSTCTIAASYEAKQCGVKTGTLVPEARRLCPGIVLVKARPRIYVQIHHRVLQSVDQCAQVERVYSIDEWSFRLRGEDRHPAQAQRLARRIKRQIGKDFGPWMTCSIGIASTRLLAKIASNLQKPDGLVVLEISDLPDRLDHLPLESLCGIGHGMRVRLEGYGIRTVRELWAIRQEQAVRIWGSVAGASWWAGFHGHDEPEQPIQRRSMSHSNVLAPPFRNEESAHGILVKLVCKLAYRLRQVGYSASSLQVSVQDLRGARFSDEIGLPRTNDTPTLLGQFSKLWQRRPASLSPPKKVGVCVTGLELTSQLSRVLFDEIDKLQHISQAIDEINHRWGPSAIYYAPAHPYRDALENKIAFGRIPDECEW
ncbi:MAG: type VI secretion protein ImpB [Pirellulales bacterium]|nr:type VI secretion protein ImpB [Pirellulales bacterium]